MFGNSIDTGNITPNISGSNFDCESYVEDEPLSICDHKSCVEDELLSNCDTKDSVDDETNSNYHTKEKLHDKTNSNCDICLVEDRSAASRSESAGLPLDKLGSEDTWSLALLEAACHHIIIGVGWPSSGTGGRAGGLSLWLSGVSTSLWNWIGDIVIAPCGAMFNPDPNFWRGNTSPLNMCMVG